MGYKYVGCGLPVFTPSKMTTTPLSSMTLGRSRAKSMWRWMGKPQKFTALDVAEAYLERCKTDEFSRNHFRATNGLPCFHGFWKAICGMLTVETASSIYNRQTGQSKTFKSGYSFYLHCQLHDIIAFKSVALPVLRNAMKGR